MINKFTQGYYILLYEYLINFKELFHAFGDDAVRLDHAIDATTQNPVILLDLAT